MSYNRAPTEDFEPPDGPRPILQGRRSFPPRIPAPAGPYLPPANTERSQTTGFSPLSGDGARSPPQNPFQRESYIQQDGINPISSNEPRASAGSFNRDQIQSPNSEIPLLSEKHGSQYIRTNSIPQAELPEHDLSRPFRRGEQIWQHFKAMFGRIFVSVVIAACLGGVLYWYENSGVLGDTAKYNFNAAFTGLSICLGLNVASSFKGMATIFRWRVLTSSKGHSVKELDLVLGMSSYQNCWVLLGKWIRKPSYFFPMLGWVLLGIVS